MENNPEQEENIQEVYRALGEFTVLFSGIEYFFTGILAFEIEGILTDTYILLQGMSLPVKIRKLRIILKRKIPQDSKFFTLLNNYEKVIKFRNKIQHWSHFTNPDNTALRLKDIGRNPKDIFGNYVNVSARDLEQINKYMSTVHTELFLLHGAQIYDGESRFGDPLTLLSDGEPPIPN